MPWNVLASLVVKEVLETEIDEKKCIPSFWRYQYGTEVGFPSEGKRLIEDSLKYLNEEYFVKELFDLPVISEEEQQQDRVEFRSPSFSFWGPGRRQEEAYEREAEGQGRASFSFFGRQLSMREAEGQIWEEASERNRVSERGRESKGGSQIRGRASGRGSQIRGRASFSFFGRQLRMREAEGQIWEEEYGFFTGKKKKKRIRTLH